MSDDLQLYEDPVDFKQISMADLGPSPSRWIAARQGEGLVHEAMHRLPLELQLAIELFYFENMSAPEVARVLDIPEGTVRSRVRRGLEKLRDDLSRHASDAKSAQHTVSRLVELLDVPE